MPTLTLPERFKKAPFHGDYYKIMGLNSNPTAEQINTAYRTMAQQYHPDKIAISPVKPALTTEEATQCFQAIQEIKSILLNHCNMLKAEFKPSAKEKIISVADLSPGEQLKAVMLGYTRSARFCDYPEGTGPDVPGYWSYIVDGQNAIEIGTSRYSRNAAIATPDYQVEASKDWSHPLIVLNKRTQPFTPVVNPDEVHRVLKMMANSIPETQRTHCAKIYGSHVQEMRSLAEAAQKAYVINDSEGNNYVDGIRHNADQSFTILGRNSKNQPRQITLFQNGKVLGFNPNGELGVVETQFFENREEIFHHFGLELSEAMPGLRNLGYRP